MFYAILGIVVAVALFLIFRDDHDSSYNNSYNKKEKGTKEKGTKAEKKASGASLRVLKTRIAHRYLSILTASMAKRAARRRPLYSRKPGKLFGRKHRYFSEFLQKFGEFQRVLASAGTSGFVALSDLEIGIELESSHLDSDFVNEFFHGCFRLIIYK